MGKLAFFPWLDIEEAVECDGFRLLRYRRGQAPGEDAADQAVIDGVLAPYYDAHGKPVARATLLQHSSQNSPTSDLDESYHVDLFVFSDLLAFAGLAGRRFFGHFQYSNRDNYGLILQQFTEPGGGALITTRRRDGSTDVFFPGDVYKVQRPAHVHHDRVTVDENLLASLVAAMAHPDWPQIYQAIVLFNEANTDRLEMPPGTEVILLYAAMEQALGVPSKRPKIVAQRFAEVFAPQAVLPPSEWKVGRENEPGGTLLKNSANLRTAWLQDLANSRGSLAHGHSTEAYPACWQPHEHLLFGAHVLPLVVKLRLRDMAGYELTAEDRAGIQACEPLLNERHFGEAEAGQDKHPWGGDPKFSSRSSMGRPGCKAPRHR